MGSGRVVTEDEVRWPRIVAIDLEQNDLTYPMLVNALRAYRDDYAAEDGSKSAAEIGELERLIHLVESTLD
jgi:hypothetical protein